MAKPGLKMGQRCPKDGFDMDRDGRKMASTTLRWSHGASELFYMNLCLVVDGPQKHTKHQRKLIYVWLGCSLTLIFVMMAPSVFRIGFNMASTWPEMALLKKPMEN